MTASQLNRACTVCNSLALKTMIDFGEQPPANRFLAQDFCQTQQSTHALALGYCEDCDTSQLTQRMPIDAIRPQFHWLIYNEPEGHLDKIAEQLFQLPGITPGSKILGVTYKDQSTIDRLIKLGLPHSHCIAEQDFKCTAQFFGLETIQQLLRDPKVMTDLKAKYGQADMVLLRHVIEHSDDATALITALRHLLTPNGYLVMELPDSEHILKSGNHAFIWEEHISYFTEQSLAALANAAGAEMAWFQRCSYPYEDSLLVAFQFSSLKSGSKTQPVLSESAILLENFKNELTHAQREWRELLISYRKEGKKIAVFGAGHLAVKFINFFELSGYLDCVIDDNPHKAGMKMPGSCLPIEPSKILSEQGITLCISTLSPESDSKVRQKLSAYFEGGGLMISAFKMKVPQS